MYCNTINLIDDRNNENTENYYSVLAENSRQLIPIRKLIKIYKCVSKKNHKKSSK